MLKEFSDISINLGTTWILVNSCKEDLTVTNRYADPCRFYRNKEWEVYMVVGNAFSNCNGSSAFSALIAFGPVKVEIWKNLS
jgi:hypothetical protein